MKNINITGTFTEYMESIVTEMSHIVPKDYSIRVEDNFWGTAISSEGGTPCKVIFITENHSGPCNHFSIAKLEFMTLQQYAPEALVKLATARFAAAIDSLKGLRDVFSEAINKFEMAL